MAGMRRARARDGESAVAGVIAQLVGVRIDWVVLVTAAETDEGATGSPGAGEDARGRVEVDRVRLDRERPLHDGDLDAQRRDWDVKTHVGHQPRRPRSGRHDDGPGRKNAVGRTHAADAVPDGFDAEGGRAFADHGPRCPRGACHAARGRDGIDIPAVRFVGGVADVVPGSLGLQLAQLSAADDAGGDTEAVLQRHVAM
jgi:hypothetical protein